MNTVLSVKNINKSFPGVKALDDVSMEIYPGQVHTIIGENGAGKSTLMKILAGMYQPDSGEIIMNGKVMHFNRSIDAIQSGIAMVHQELMPVMEMIVAENIYLGREPVFGKSGLVNWKKMINDTENLFKRLNLKISPRKKMKELGVAEIQLVEIARAISRNASIIIMDEPTSAITQDESENLFLQIEKLKQERVAIIYISHKMEEIMRISDRIIVLRDGRKISEYEAAAVNINVLIKDMVGRELDMMFPVSEARVGDVCLEAQHISVKKLLDDVSINVRCGEVLGLAGLMGAGRTELVESIFGLRKTDGGTVIKNGKKLAISQPSDAIRNGIALLTEDRKGNGLNLTASVKDNISILSLKRITRLGIVNRRQEKKICNQMIEELSIKMPGMEQIVESLSGGNMQKVVLAKWLLTNSDVFILDEPTRGIDVNAKYEIYKIIRRLSAEGKAVILISSEMPEIIGLCDRVYVMYEGRITGEVAKHELNQETVMRYASGLS